MNHRFAARILALGLVVAPALRAEIHWEETPTERIMIRLEGGQEVFRKVYPRPSPGPGAVDRGHLKGAMMEQVAAPMPEQGALVTCVYCTRIRPGVGAACPRCHGKQTGFQPAQMMDGESSRRHLLGMLAEVGEAHRALLEAGEAGQGDAARELRDRMVAVRAAMDLYGFDLGVALEECVRRLEDEHGLR